MSAVTTALVGALPVSDAWDDHRHCQTPEKKGMPHSKVEWTQAATLSVPSPSSALVRTLATIRVRASHISGGKRAGPGFWRRFAQFRPRHEENGG